MALTVLLVALLAARTTGHATGNARLGQNWMAHPSPVDLSPQTPCVTALAHSVNATGFVSVLPFLTSSPRDHPGDDSPAVNAAINMSRACMGAGVFLPNSGHGGAGPPHGGARGYRFGTTVTVGSRLHIKGGGFNGVQFVEGGMATVYCPLDGPCFHIGPGQLMRLEALEVVGHGIAVLVQTAAAVQFVHVAFIATHDVDGIDTSPAGCDGCNVNLGSSNAALVIINSYWITLSHCSFTFYPDYRQNGTVTSPAEKGQRPSVILRGETPDKGCYDQQTNTVYLVHFEHSVFSGGGVQYQQTEHGDQWPGFFTLDWSVLEVSSTPLLDLQAAPNATLDWRKGTLAAFVGLHSVTITEVAWVDPPPSINYVKKYPAISDDTGGNAVGVVAINCTVFDCGIDGLFMTSSSSSMGAAGGGAPALRIFAADHATGVTVNTGGMTAAPDVLDSKGVPFGNWVSRSEGGWVAVGTVTGNGTNESALSAHGAGVSTHALLLGMAGESSGRMALDFDGTMRWGNGIGDFDTLHRGNTAHTTAWDPPALAPGKRAKLVVATPGAQLGDVATISHTAPTADWGLVWSARVAETGTVVVVLLNTEEETIDVDGGTLRVVLGRFE